VKVLVPSVAGGIITIGLRALAASGAKVWQTISIKDVLR
jgi:hypothetical protein